jgi:hypothetical protein
MPENRVNADIWYSLRPLLLIANTDVSRHILEVDTSILETSKWPEGVVNLVSFDCCPSNSFMLVDLQDGELVHGENFSLFAAMSALEVRITLFSLLFSHVSNLFFLSCALQIACRNDVFVYTEVFYATSSYYLVDM